MKYSYIQETPSTKQTDGNLDQPTSPDCWLTGLHRGSVFRTCGWLVKELATCQDTHAKNDVTEPQRDSGQHEAACDGRFPTGILDTTNLLNTITRTCSINKLDLIVFPPVCVESSPEIDIPWQSYTQGLAGVMVQSVLSVVIRHQTCIFVSTVSSGTRTSWPFRMWTTTDNLKHNVSTKFFTVFDDLLSMNVLQASHVLEKSSGGMSSRS